MLPGERPLRFFIEPIAAELEDNAVTEIVINRPGEVGIERNNRWHWREVPEFTLERLEQIGILTCQLAGKDFDEAHPIGYATLPDGQRFTICRSPVTSKDTIAINIRIPAASIDPHLTDAYADLQRDANTGQSPSAAADEIALIDHYHARRWDEFFPLVVKSHKTIVCSGVTGSGKTTWLRKFLHLVPLHERLVTIEDTVEFGVLPPRNRVSLFFGAVGVTAEMAVELALRQRPDRIIMQELRGREAYAFLRAQRAGHGGGMTTIHSNRGADAAFATMATLVKSHPDAQDRDIADLNAELRSLVDIVCWCSRDETGFHMPQIWFRAAEEKEAP
jgi:type IV secretion system protein VirB11